MKNNEIVNESKWNKFYYSTNDINSNKFDIYEIGADKIAFGLSWEYTVYFLNILNNCTNEK